MAASEFNTVLFKVLFYAYECLKAGVEPDIAKARELADVNERYLQRLSKKQLMRDIFPELSLSPSLIVQNRQ